MATEQVNKSDKKKSYCKNKCKPKLKGKNGKGDSPRNNCSDKFRNNYDNINWIDK